MKEEELGIIDTGLQIDSDKIETMFKVEPPFTAIENGYGYYGIVLRDKEKDILQCHICGKWCKSLSAHINMAHKIKSREYKMGY